MKGYKFGFGFDWFMCLLVIIVFCRLFFEWVMIYKLVVDKVFMYVLGGMFG